MATNPMQRKSRISFLLGMLVMLVIAALVIVLLYMRIQSQQKELAEYKKTTKVFVLNRDVVSGQELTADMFTQKNVATSATPANAALDLSMLENAKIVDTLGRVINPPTGEKNYYYYSFEGQQGDAIIYKLGSDDVPVDFLQPGDKAYYKDANKQNVQIEVARVNSVIAKIDMKANTILTRSAITASDERTTDDLRKEEYNVITLPVDLGPDEYVDIRLMLPNGQNYIVVSKKKVTIPVSNGAYLADTIQMNLTEEEILLMSSAIVENFQIDGSKLYASRYVEAGNQNVATVTYAPSDSILALISNDPNAVPKAINGILNKRKSIQDSINSAKNKYGLDENIKTKTEESVTSTIEERKNYLQTLVPGVQ